MAALYDFIEPILQEAAATAVALLLMHERHIYL
jgi:hypothetical protein